MATMMLKANRDRNKPMAKMSKAQLAEALAAHDRIKEASTAIRRRAGLDPVADNQLIEASRERMGAAKAPKLLTPSEQLAELVKRRQKLDRDREKYDADLRELIGSRKVAVSMIARALGLSRQRCYQMVA